MTYMVLFYRLSEICIFLQTVISEEKNFLFYLNWGRGVYVF